MFDIKIFLNTYCILIQSVYVNLGAVMIYITGQLIIVTMSSRSQGTLYELIN